MAGRQYDCMDLCPEGYSLLSNPTALAEAMGYDDLNDFCDVYEIEVGDIAVWRNKFKYWNDIVPSGYGTCDCYIIATEVMTWQENMIILDMELEDICDDNIGGYHVFLLSTEGWGMM